MTLPKELNEAINKAISDAYDAGLQSANRPVVNIDAGLIVKHFLEFTTKYRIVRTDAGVMFADEKFMYTPDHVINLFKLSYGYDESNS